MKKSQRFCSWIRKGWDTFGDWRHKIKIPSQVARILKVLLTVAFIILVFLLSPWLGRWNWLDAFRFWNGLWDGLERFGNFTGLITVALAFWGFLNTRRLLQDRRTSESQPMTPDQSNETFDVFIRVSDPTNDSASMDDFLKHCANCCPYSQRSWPSTTKNGKTVHLSALFEDNNNQGFDSEFHQKLFQSYRDDAPKVKRRFQALLKPVMIRYGAATIRERSNQAVYFYDNGIEHPENQQVEGERILEVWFPMDLPRENSEKRKVFLAYFSSVLRYLFAHLHNVRLYYQGPTLLPCIIGDIVSNNHTLELYQYDSKSKSYYLMGNGDPDVLISDFRASIK